MENCSYFKITKIYFVQANFRAQVGINTADPKATLDVNGNVVILSTPQTSTLPGYKVLVVKDDTFEVGDADPGLFFSGSNSNIAKATSASGLSLLALDVNLLNPNWSTLKFGNLEITPSLFTSTSSNFYYNVPSSGKYIINP